MTDKELINLFLGGEFFIFTNWNDIVKSDNNLTIQGNRYLYSFSHRLAYKMENDKGYVFIADSIPHPDIQKHCELLISLAKDKGYKICYDAYMDE